MGGYNGATVRALACNQKRANQQNAMRDGEMGKGATLGLHPTPRQQRETQLKKESLRIEDTIAKLLRAEDFGCLSNRRMLVENVVKLLSLPRVGAAKAQFPEISFGSVKASIDAEDPTKVSFHGSETLTQIGWSQTVDVDALITAEGVAAGSKANMTLSEGSYIYFDSEVWGDFVASLPEWVHAAKRMDCYIQAAPRYDVYRHISVTADQCIQENCSIKRNCVNRQFLDCKVKAPTVGKICRLLADQHGLGADVPQFSVRGKTIEASRGTVCHKDIAASSTILDLPLGDIGDAETFARAGLYYLCKRDVRDATNADHAFIEVLQGGIATYAIFADLAQAMFDHCQIYYGIIQDALQLYKTKR